jgi:hypothetical protein
MPGSASIGNCCNGSVTGALNPCVKHLTVSGTLAANIRSTTRNLLAPCVKFVRTCTSPLSPGASLSFQLTRAPLSGHLRTGDDVLITELISRNDTVKNLTLRGSYIYFFYFQIFAILIFYTNCDHLFYLKN